MRALLCQCSPPRGSGRRHSLLRVALQSGHSHPLPDSQPASPVSHGTSNNDVSAVVPLELDHPVAAAMPASFCALAGADCGCQQGRLVLTDGPVFSVGRLSLRFSTICRRNHRVCLPSSALAGAGTGVHPAPRSSSKPGTSRRRHSTPVATTRARARRGAIGEVGHMPGPSGVRCADPSASGRLRFGPPLLIRSRQP